jgi:RNA polymerase sigma factor (sigma-70 family)
MVEISPPARSRFSEVMKKVIPFARRRSHSMMMAVVVGAALASSLQSEKAEAAQPSDKTVNDISRYCQACWRNARLHPDSWSDATQEVLTRLLESVAPAKWSALLKDKDGVDRREFLRAIDAVKKRTQRAKKFSGLAEDVTDHRAQPEESRNELREVVDRAAGEVLSGRQRDILQLSYDGWTVPEIADQLHTSVERVSDEKYKAIRKLRKHLNVG